MGKKPITKLPKHATELEADIVALIGRLMVQWANCESWFIKLLAALLRSDTYRAEIVFYTLTTAVARRTLLHRLFMIYVTDPDLRDKIRNLLDRFKTVTDTRNKFAHAEYQFQPLPPYIVSTKFSADFDGTKWKNQIYINKNLLNEVKQGILNCVNLTYEVVGFVNDVSPAILEKPPMPLHKHAETP